MKFQPISRKAAAQLWHRARRWDRETRSPRVHGGIIGRTALTVLYTLIYDFLNWKSGRLDPSIAGIASKSGMSPRAVATALAKLKALGLIAWQRRCETAVDAAGRFLLRQRSNAYSILHPKSWRAFDTKDPPEPLPHEIGAVPPLPTALDEAASAISRGQPLNIYERLMSDQTDRLAVALAHLGRSAGAI